MPRKVGDKWMCPYEGCESASFQEAWKVGSAAPMKVRAGGDGGPLAGVVDYERSRTCWEDCTDVRFECASCCREVSILVAA